MKKRDNPERRLQIAVAQYLSVALKPPTIFTAFPAGGGGRVRGAFLKAMGLKAGWPDILVLRHGMVLGIELKAAKGRLTPEQKAVQFAFEQIGAWYAVCRSIEDVAEALRAGAVPNRATVARASA